jgi:signal transduction histidine kinase/ActR/RegA family two-component response regulator
VPKDRSSASSVSDEDRFLVLAPTGRDAELTCALLARAGLVARACETLEELTREVRSGAAALLIAEEVLRPTATGALEAVLHEQPPWSDLPVLVFTGEGTGLNGRAHALGLLGPRANVTLLDRPLRPVTMLSAARAAARARHRQYEARVAMARQERAVRERDQFLAMLGHELRNPLGNILLAVELLSRDPDADPIAQHDLIRQQARHLTRIVDDLLDVARVTSGKVVLQREDLDLRDLVMRCVSVAATQVRSQGLSMRIEPSEGPLRVDGDRVRLEQVFGNLLGNAIKYTPRGGHVVVSMGSEPGAAVVRVRDDGVGLDHEMRTRLFELFAQSARTLDRSEGGLGVGLTLVRTLVELHGGAVEANSDGDGQGSELVVRIPLLAHPRPAPRPKPAAPRGKGGRVLVVEDNPDTLQLMIALLDLLGHQGEGAADGLAGVERALALKPPIVLVDIGLPKLDGYGVAQRIRAALGSEPLLVALNGYGQPEDRTRALESGFDVHITKPVDTAELQRVLSLRETSPHPRGA